MSNRPAHTSGLIRRLLGLAYELTPLVFAVLAFGAGALMLVSAVTPEFDDRLRKLTGVVSPILVDLSHFVGSIAGFLLLMLSAGLWRRRRGAYWAALAVLGIGAVFSVLKGLDWQQATDLLIVAALDDAELAGFLQLTESLGMHALVEAHTPEEIERGVAAGARILGVNVRNLKTLDVDPARYAALADGLPEDVVRVAESGVESEEQIKAYAAAGADVVLVGEALVRHGAPEEALRAFRAASLTVR